MQSYFGKGEGAPSRLVAGVELGGTKCICTLASGPDGIACQESLPTASPDETLGAIAEILGRWWQDNGFAALGIASFGPVDLDVRSPGFGRVGATNKPGWRDADVAGRLSGPFSVPLAFDTDVNGAALAEMAWGSGRGCADFAYVTVGTGVGVGLVVHGRPTRGIGHSELGHLRIPRLAGDDAESVCDFHDDCVEGLASGSAVKARLGGQSVGSAGPDHPVWAPVAHGIAQLCHALVCAAGPMRIAIGGGVMTRQPHLLDRIEPMLRDSLNGYMPLPADRPYIVAPELGDQAGPLGPIAMALQSLES